MGFQGIRDAYETGRGRMRMRAVAHIEPQKGGHEAIVITELPFQVKKGGDDGVIRKIAELVNDKVLTASATSPTSPTSRACGSGSS